MQFFLQNPHSNSFYHLIFNPVNNLDYIPARGAIFGFIEIWYNRKRLHSYNDYMSPTDFEEIVLRNEMVA